MEGTLLEVEQLLEHAGSGPSRSLIVWMIDTGCIARTVVDATAVLAVYEPSRNRPGKVDRLLLVQEEAGPDVVRWLVDAFHGRLAGPLVAQANQIDAELGFLQVPIDHNLDDRHCRVSSPGRLRLETSCGAPAVTPIHAPGMPALYNAQVLSLQLDIPEHGIHWPDGRFRAIQQSFCVGGGGDKWMTP